MITVTLANKKNHTSQYNNDIEHISSPAYLNSSFSSVRDPTAEGVAGEPVQRGVCAKSE